MIKVFSLRYDGDGAGYSLDRICQLIDVQELEEHAYSTSLSRECSCVAKFAAQSFVDLF
jgi:hypothetical protein